MNTTSRKRSYTSANVSAGKIAESINRRTDAGIGWRDVMQKATELGIVFHADKYGSSCYSASEAEILRDELEKDFTRKELFPTPAAPSNLSGYSDADLVAELRRRGWDVKAQRVTTESL